MRNVRIPAEEQYRLIMECRNSRLTDYQWCVEHDIKPGTFYNWVKRLRQKGCTNFPAATGRSHSAFEKQEVVKVDLKGPATYDQPISLLDDTADVNISVPDHLPMKFSVGKCTLTIPNGTEPFLLAHTLRIIK